MTIIRPDIDLIYRLLTAKYIDLSLFIDYSTFFQGRNPILLLSIQSSVRLMEVFNKRNKPNNFSVRVRLIEVSAE